MNKPNFGSIKTNLITESFYDSATNVTEKRMKNRIKRKFNEIIEIIKENNGDEPTNKLRKDLKTLLENILDDRCDSEDLYVFKHNGIKLKATINGKHALILKSPFVTKCDKWWYENLGDLSKPNENGKETYCLPDTWFESGKAPYEYKEIKND